MIPYEHGSLEPIKLPKRQDDRGYERPPRDIYRYVPDASAELLARTNSKPKSKKKKDK
jgi:polyphosphate kinase